MHQKKRIPSIASVIVAIGLGAAWPAWGLGFGNGTPSATLGRPLDFRVVVRLSDGEVLDNTCVRAAVVVGERSLPAQSIATLVTTGPDNTAVIRVRTSTRIDEPLVTVDVQAGCVQRLSRSYTVFADPPLSPMPVAADQLAQAAARPSAPAGVDASAVTPPPQPPVTPVASVVTRPAEPVAVQAAAAVPPRQAPKPRPKPRPKPQPKVVATPEAVAAQPAARLRLDEPQVVLPTAATPAAAVSPESAETLMLVDRANEAVKAAIAAASASQARIAALERSVRELGNAARDQQRLLAQLNARAEAAESGSRWLWPLLLAMLVLAGLAAWLWVRLRELERERRQGWLAVAQSAAPARPAAAERHPPAAAPAQRAEVPTPSQVPLLVERGQRHGGLGAVGAGLAPVHQPTPSEMPDPTPTQPPAWYDDVPPSQRTMPLVSMPALGPAPAAAGSPPRDVSAEELIDLEQQAEFFVVLGQDDAAIDLLVSHLRDAGGASPLPYLKLLDIYHRREDRAAYERTRDRFNQRFNGHAPAWDAAGHDGRSLEDYPAVINWLQRVWPQPLDAMAELESLLFRKDGGELFDLPAYRELLMLYGLARDLLESTSGGAAAVDVLLPLNDAPGFVQTSPRPYFGDDDAPPEVQPTAPLDLDLGPAHNEPVIDRRR